MVLASMVHISTFDMGGVNSRERLGRSEKIGGGGGKEGEER